MVSQSFSLLLCLPDNLLRNSKLTGRIQICREDQLEGSDKVELGVLAGQIMAIKEGLGRHYTLYDMHLSKLSNCY